MGLGGVGLFVNGIVLLDFVIGDEFDFIMVDVLCWFE